MDDKRTLEGRGRGQSALFPLITFWQIKFLSDSPLQVRLVGSPFPEQGRVELYRNGFWGTICADGWGIPDAAVVCRMLGYSGAWSISGIAKYGQGDGPIWLDKLACTGSETSLLKCPHGEWGKTSCDHSKDAGVICYSPRTQKPPTKPQPTSPDQPKSTSSAQPQPTYVVSSSTNVVQSTPALVRSSLQVTSTIASVSPTASCPSVQVGPTASAGVVVTPPGKIQS